MIQCSIAITRMEARPKKFRVWYLGMDVETKKKHNFRALSIRQLQKTVEEKMVRQWSFVFALDGKIF